MDAKTAQGPDAYPPDKVSGYKKGGAVSKSKPDSSAAQAFENNKAETLVYPGPAQGLKKGGAVKAKGGVPPARGGWKRWGSK